MFKITIEWDKCEGGEKGKFEQEIPYSVLVEIANILAKFLGISIGWPKKGGD